MNKDTLNNVSSFHSLMGPIFSLIFMAFESNHDLWVHLFSVTHLCYKYFDAICWRSISVGCLGRFNCLDSDLLFFFWKKNN